MKHIIVAAVMLAAVALVASTYAQETESEGPAPNALDLILPPSLGEDCDFFDFRCPRFTGKPFFCDCLPDGNEEEPDEIAEFIRNMKCREAPGLREFYTNTRIPSEKREALLKATREALKDLPPIEDIPRATMPELTDEDEDAEFALEVLRRVCREFPG